MEEEIQEESRTPLNEDSEKPTGEGDAGTEEKDLEKLREVVEGEAVEGEYAEGEHVEGELVEGEHVEGEEAVKGEGVDGEGLEEEKAEGEGLREGEEKVADECVKGEEYGEEMLGEHVEGEEAITEEQKKEEEKPADVEFVEEEEAYVEEPPPDPAAPYDFSDSKEALKEPFELRPDQLAEVEQLWEFYQDYTPAYTDIDNYITKKELIYMLKALILLPFTPEQLDELIDYCVRPPDPNGHINFDQFVKMVKLRQRDFPIEEELRANLQVMDPQKTGAIDREYLKDTLRTLGHKMPEKQLNNLIKEVDIANDGTIGIEDVVGTMCIDLNREDIQMLIDQIYPPEKAPDEENEL